MTRKKTLIGLVVLAALATVAAAAALQSYTAAWVAPTVDVNGVALTGPVTYQVYAGTPGKETAYGVPVSTLAEAVLPAAAGTLCVTVTAIVSGVASDPSPEVCVIVAGPPPVVVPPVVAKPKPPTAVTLK